MTNIPQVKQCNIMFLVNHVYIPCLLVFFFVSVNQKLEQFNTED